MEAQSGYRSSTPLGMQQSPQMLESKKSGVNTVDWQNPPPVWMIMTYNDLYSLNGHSGVHTNSCRILSSSCITCFRTFAFKCSFDGGDTVDGYIIYDFNIYIHDHHSTATDAVKLREIFTRLRFQVIHSLRREPSLVPLAFFFSLPDGTGHMKIWFMFCWDYCLIARMNCSIDRTWDCRFFSTVFIESYCDTLILSSLLEPSRHSRWTLEKTW